MNERNTENLVRKMLRDKGYYGNDNNKVIVEEQISDSPRIQKLLKNASKTGNGRGRPEFIIRFEDSREDLIVIECKASILDHQSTDKFDASKYAVDGALLYADYLKNEFNVTAIGVSGESERENRISTYLWRKQHYVPEKINEGDFPTPSDIENIIVEKTKPLSQDQLVQKAIEYNGELQGYAIPETERCTLISSILVALQDKPFVKAYDEHKCSKQLLQSLYEACKRVLSLKISDPEKVQYILDEYKKNQHNQKLNDSKNQILKNLIIKIEKDILPLVKEKDFDILGKFYTQFIRYAGKDSKTGLVLTPSHITDFFCDIANIGVNDIVFDPCCGTGGFLVSAMNYMIKKADHNGERIKKIRSDQLIGVEIRSDMFSYVCSNMMMRGDGKSNIYFGDYKDYEGVIRSKNPNITFLNPPYYQDNTAAQLKFVDDALGCLCKGGIGIAICQMSTATSSSKEVIEARRKLLERHTLKAVFSMPDDLFYPVGVVACIFVFEAHKPHSDNLETFFGYFKDDGFVKRKSKGRIDHGNQWHKIKDQWLDAYFNRKNIAGLSVCKRVTAQDEWCAEAYMETDYSTLTKKEFVETIKNYVAFKFLNDCSDEAS